MIYLIYILFFLIRGSCSKHCWRVLNTHLCRAVYRVGLLNENTHDSLIKSAWWVRKHETWSRSESCVFSFSNPILYYFFYLFFIFYFSWLARLAPWLAWLAPWLAWLAYNSHGSLACILVQLFSLSQSHWFQTSLAFHVHLKNFWG